MAIGAGQDWKEPTYEYGKAPIGPAGVDTRIWQGIWEAGQRQERTGKSQGEQYREGIVPGQFLNQPYGGVGGVYQTPSGPVSSATPEKLPAGSYYVGPPGTIAEQQQPSKQEIVTNRVNPVEQAAINRGLIGRPIQDSYTQAPPVSAQKQTVSGLYSSTYKYTYDTSSGSIGMPRKFDASKRLVSQDNMLLTNLAAGFGGEQKFSSQLESMGTEGGLSSPYVLYKAARFGPSAVQPKEAFLATFQTASLLAPVGGGAGKATSLGVGTLTRAGSTGFVEAVVSTRTRGILGLGRKTFRSDVKLAFDMPKLETEFSTGAAAVSTRQIRYTAPTALSYPRPVIGKEMFSLQGTKALTIFKRGEESSLAKVAGFRYDLAKSGFSDAKFFKGVVGSSKFNEDTTRSVGMFKSGKSTELTGMFVKEARQPPQTFTGFRYSAPSAQTTAKSQLTAVSKGIEAGVVTKTAYPSFAMPAIKTPTVAKTEFKMQTPSTSAKTRQVSFSPTVTAQSSRLSLSPVTSQKTSQTTRATTITGLGTSLIMEPVIMERITTRQSQRQQQSPKTDSLLKTLQRDTTQQTPQRATLSPRPIRFPPFGFGLPSVPLIPLTGLGGRFRMKPPYRPFKSKYKPSIAGILSGRTIKKAPKNVGEIRLPIAQKKGKIKW